MVRPATHSHGHPSVTIRAGRAKGDESRPQPLNMVHSGSFRVNRSAEEVFDLIANPEQFAPLLPDFDSMAVQDATHFTLRIAVAVGRINGHVNLAMELCQAERPSQVEYKGQGVIAGGQLSMGLRFQFTATSEGTGIDWQGEVALGGALAFMVGDLLETMGRQNFERMAERLRDRLRQGTQPDETPAPEPAEFDSEL